MQIQIQFYCIHNQMIFTNTLQKIRKLDWILEIMNQTDHYQRGKKIIGLMKDELSGKTMINFVGLKPKTYSFLIDDGGEDKISRRDKKVDRKKKN